MLSPDRQQSFHRHFAGVLFDPAKLATGAGQPSDSPAAWEKSAPAVPAPTGRISPNIRPKRKVASLLGGSKG